MGKITINELEIDVIRAWKDEDYRNSLSEEQRSQLPDNPAGVIDLSDETAKSVVGGKFTDRLRRGTKGISHGVGCKGTKGFTNGFGCKFFDLT